MFKATLLAAMALTSAAAIEISMEAQTELRS